MPDHGRRVPGDVDAAAPCADVSDQMPDANPNEILFRYFVVPEIPLLLHVASSLTGQPADAEDLVQDTLIRVYRAIARFDGQHPRAWLLTILRNTHRNRVRRRQPALLDESLTDLAHTPAFGMPPPTPEQLLVDNTLDTAVAQALGKLPSRFRRVLELVDVAGLSYAQAATVLDVPEGTVMSRLHRGRNRMRDALTVAGFLPGGIAE